ncbi:hypothetical protein OG225_18720 [Nocardia sp. NBC_01377]|uniref:hypothetical protein n=1 Tax=Nocardia sp. NBC_01377 TaxID=2903595 RepID=UPI003250ADDD
MTSIDDGDLDAELLLADGGAALRLAFGDEDTAVTGEAAARCGEHLTGDYEFVELSGVGHWIPEQAADLLAAAIVSRVDGAHGGGGSR